jgi:hypothetical protein
LPCFGQAYFTMGHFYEIMFTCNPFKIRTSKKQGVEGLPDVSVSARIIQRLTLEHHVLLTYCILHKPSSLGVSTPKA